MSRLNRRKAMSWLMLLSYLGLSMGGVPVQAQPIPIKQLNPPEYLQEGNSISEENQNVFQEILGQFSPVQSIPDSEEPTTPQSRNENSPSSESNQPAANLDELWGDITLTDQTGQVEINPADDIQINLPEGMTTSDISRIDVYRNQDVFYRDIKISTIDLETLIFTNSEMKTFTGLRSEASPASSHTDHAITGYEYIFKIYDKDETFRTELSTIIQANHRFSGERIINIGIGSDFGWRDISTVTQSQLAAQFTKQYGDNFDVLSFQVYYIIDDGFSNTIRVQTYVDPSVHGFARTLNESEIRKILGAIDMAGYDAELRVETWLTEENHQKEPYYWHRGSITPRNVHTWFQNYGNFTVPLSTMLQEECYDPERDGPINNDMFTPFVEMGTTQHHGEEMEEFFQRVRDEGGYTGRLSVSFQANLWLTFLGSGYDQDQDSFETIANRDTYWEFPGMEIGMNLWPSGVWDTQNDQRYSEVKDNLTTWFSQAIDYYQSKYPEVPLRLGELGMFNFDGAVKGFDRLLYGGPWEPVDTQEGADIFQAYMEMAIEKRIDGIVVFSIMPWNAEKFFDAGDILLDYHPARRVIEEYFKRESSNL